MSDENKKGSEDGLESLRKALQGVSNPGLQDYLKKINFSSYSKIVEEIRNSPSLQSMQAIGVASAEVEKVKKLMQLADFGRNIPSIKLPYDPAELVGRWNLTANHDAINKALSSLAETGKALARFSKIYSFLMPTSEMAWLDTHMNSLLFKYMSSNAVDALDSGKFVGLEGIASVSINASEAAVISPTIEAEIVGELEQGGELSDLSDKAKEYFLAWWPYFKLFLEIMAMLITFQQFYETKISAAKSPAELRTIVKNMPVEHRELFEGERVVIGDSVILRAGPGKKTAVLARMDLGTRLVVKAERGSWIHVVADVEGDDLEGWVYSKYTLKL